MSPHYLPTESLRVALVELRRPFTPAAVRFKVQAAQRTMPEAASKDYALIVAYVDARLVIERLNLVVGAGWYDSLALGQVEGGGTVATCALTVLGVTRSDVGEATGLAQAKALRSDALKRAAVKFGVGVSVYASPRIVLKHADGLRPITLGLKGHPSWALTQRAEARCRRRYAEWLTKVGTKAFGEPLDHGDIEVSQGDWEIEDVAESEATASEPLTYEQRTDLFAAAHGLDETTVELLCIAANVKSVSELTQATLPAFRGALAAHMAGVGR